MPGFFARLTLCLALAISARPALALEDHLSQAEALQAASVANRIGSDRSLQNSTTDAMRALLELNNQNRPAAINNGYKSYGEYRTSEDLDTVRIKNRIRRLDLWTNTVAVDSKVPSWIKEKENFQTTYGRLDPKFLREGDAGKVAEEFEKKSGMKREEFLKRLTKASENRIAPDDPKLMEKVMSRLTGFVNEIPNEEFRKNIQKNIDDVPETFKTGLVAKGVQKIYEIMADIRGKDKNLVAAEQLVAKEIAARTPSSVHDAPAAAVPAGTASVATAPTPDPAVAVTGKAEEQPPNTRLGAVMVPTDSDYKGLGKEKFGADAIGAAMQTALDEQGEETIFKKISKRYRAVTPLLSLVQGKP